MAATILSDKNLHLDTPSSSANGHRTPSSLGSTRISSAMSSPPLTPSFEPNMAMDFEVTEPSIVSLLRQSEGTNYKADLALLNVPELDFDDKISTLLKEGTARAHVQAETSEGAGALIKGELELQEYIRWLAVLWRLYDALELALNEHASNPVLAPTYDPAVLARSDSLAQDITFLLKQLPASTTSAKPTGAIPAGPLPPFALPAFLVSVFTQPPRALTTYLDHIKQLSSSGKTAPGLLAHSYVRYLGDLSGGQFIMAKIRRAYNLGTGLDGLRFYHFDLQGQSEEGDESRADGKRRAGEVKDWFRKGMDEGVGEDEDLKAFLVREANLAFALNTYLFSVIRLPLKQPVQELRYFEKRELEWKRRQELGLPEPEGEANTWKDRIERFFIFGTTVAVGWGVSKYVLPLVTDYVAGMTGSGGMGKSEL